MTQAIPTDRQAKPIFIVPGYKQRTTQKAYKEIAKMLKSEGYFPILVPISWKKTTIAENTKSFLQEYKKIKSKKKYILGFSFGAMIAFLAATKVDVSGLILCSLSPYFTEDIASSPLRCRALSKKIKAKQILMLYGAEEASSLIKRVIETFDQLASQEKYLIPIQNTEHDIGDKRYLHTIHQVARALI